MPKTPTAKTPPKDGASSPVTIGFRLDPEDMEMLAAIAASQEKSVHALAKEWIQQRLESPEPGVGWQQALGSVHGHLIKVRQNLALSVEAILIATGNVTEPEARSWADQHLREKPHAVNQQPNQSGQVR